jgi:hypothetical protein
MKESEVELAKKYRMAINFSVFAGDDTGLIKKVKMMYNYQTDIVGSYMTEADLSFKQDEVQNDQSEMDPKQIAKKQKLQEKYSKNAMFDKDG